MCLEIIAVVSADARARVSAPRLSEMTGLSVTSRKVEGSACLHFSVTGGCSCEFLSDAAQFEGEAWALEPDYLMPLAEGVRVLADECGKLSFLAHWLGGERDRRSMKVSGSVLFSLVRGNQIGNNVLYIAGYAESYAGPALAKILGERALSDLCALLRDAPKLASREGAAYGLARFRSPSAEAALLEAASAGRIRWLTAANVLAGIPIAPSRLCELFRSGEIKHLRLATEIVWVALSDADSGRSAWVYDVSRGVGPLVREALANPALSMAPRKRTQLEAWVSNAQ